MMTLANPWEQNIIDNAIEYSIVEWRPLNKTTKTIVKTYDEAKELFAKTIKEHSATLAYACDKNGSHANLNHLPEFKYRSKYVKSKKR
ncbi:MAG: hypothetical protein CMO44_05445 [Verrucomicrobiales bacterium]|nr:hypothetical protein [Verrucomicrobiales bacterium]